MRRFVVLQLLLIMLFQSCYNLGVTVYWFANRAYIATTLCEYRDKPEKQCNGQCFLRRNMRGMPCKASKEAPEAPVLKKGIELADCLPDLPDAFVLVSNPGASVLIPGWKQLYDCRYRGGVFKPPSA